MLKDRIQAEWEQARDDLGLEIVIPFKLDLENGVTIHAELLVKNFGGRNGMLIVKKYDIVKDNLTEIQKLGFDERFRRMWEYYLTYCEVGFERGDVDAGIYRITKPL